MKRLCRLFVTAWVLASAAAQAQEVFQPGNGVSLPIVVSEVKPEYTSEAKRAHIEGNVIVDAVVLADGKVGNVPWCDRSTAHSASTTRPSRPRNDGRSSPEGRTASRLRSAFRSSCGSDSSSVRLSDR